MRIGLVISFIACLAAAPVFSQTATIKGRVTEDSAGKEIIFAELNIKGTSIKANTDINGYYKIELMPAGEYEIEVKYLGYEMQSKKINVQPGKTFEVNFTIKALPDRLRGGPVIDNRKDKRTGKKRSHK